MMFWVGGGNRMNGGGGGMAIGLYDFPFLNLAQMLLAYHILGHNFLYLPKFFIFE